MSSHTPTCVPLDDGRWAGRCTCRWRSPDVCDTLQEAEDSNIKHMRDVERVRANARRSMPTLAQQRDYYQKKADDPAESVEDRALWLGLAVEITHRLNDRGPAVDDQPTLF